MGGSTRGRAGVDFASTPCHQPVVLMVTAPQDWRRVACGAGKLAESSRRGSWGECDEHEVLAWTVVYFLSACGDGGHASIPIHPLPLPLLTISPCGSFRDGKIHMFLAGRVQRTSTYHFLPSYQQLSVAEGNGTGPGRLRASSHLEHVDELVVAFATSPFHQPDEAPWSHLVLMVTVTQD